MVIKVPKMNHRLQMLPRLILKLLNNWKIWKRMLMKIMLKTFHQKKVKIIKVNKLKERKIKKQKMLHKNLKLIIY